MQGTGIALERATSSECSKILGKISKLPKKKIVNCEDVTEDHTIIEEITVFTGCKN